MAALVLREVGAHDLLVERRRTVESRGGHRCRTRRRRRCGRRLADGAQLPRQGLDRPLQCLGLAASLAQALVEFVDPGRPGSAPAPRPPASSSAAADSITRAIRRAAASRQTASIVSSPRCPPVRPGRSRRALPQLQPPVARHVTKRLYSETLVTESRYDASHRETSHPTVPASRARPRPAAGSCSCTSCPPRRRTCGCGRGGGCSSSARSPSSRRSTSCPTPRPRARTSSGSRPRSRPRAATPRVFAADGVDAWSDDALVEEFRRSRQDAYVALAEEIERVLDAARRHPAATRATRAAGGRPPGRGLSRAVLRPRTRSTSSAAPAATAWPPCSAHSRTRHAATRRRQPASAAAGDLTAYTGRLWVTRPRPGVDRMSSAWLIRRFIDPAARFAFAADRDALPDDAVAFDMFGVAFSHQGERLHLRDPVRRLRHRRGRGRADRRHRPRPRPEGRPLRRGRSGRHRRGHRRAPARHARRPHAPRTRHHAVRVAVPRLRAARPGPSAPRQGRQAATSGGAERPRTSTSEHGGAAALRQRRCGRRAADSRGCAWRPFVGYASYALCRTPLLPLFAQELGAGPAADRRRRLAPRR